MARRSLDSILADERSVHDLPDAPESPASQQTAPETAAETEPSATPEPEKAAAVVPAQKPEASKPTAAVAKPAEDDDELEEHVPDNLDGLKRALAAARGDKRKARKKWQDAERALAELNGKISVLQQQRQTLSPTAAPAPEAKPQAEEFDWSNPVATVERMVQTRLERARAEERQLRFAEEQAELAAEHEDYREAEAAFAQAVQANPGMRMAFLQSSKPATYAYRTGRQILALQRRGATTIEDLETKIEAEVRARLEAEYAQRQQTSPQVSAVTTPPVASIPPSAKPPIPKSLAGARGSGAGITSQWAGPRKMEDIFGA